MSQTKTITLAVIALAVLIVGNSTLFIVKEGRQAIVTQFGKPVGDPVTEAGLHVKIPFIQDARFVDKRILSWDGYPNQIPTKDKKYIKVDTTARWKITDALKFIQTVQNERGAKGRLDAILDSSTRDVISNHNLVEAVRKSNEILETVEKKKKETKDKDAKEKSIEEEVVEEIADDVERIKLGREELSQMIVKSAEKELENFGIALIDVQLRRISYEESVQSKVFERMISERERIAEKIRSIGQAERARIEGRLQRELKKIESQAYREKQEIRGRAEAKATEIYASALSRAPQFYDFMRSMEAYENALTGGDSKFILSSDSEFLKFLKRD